VDLSSQKKDVAGTTSKMSRLEVSAVKLGVESVQRRKKTSNLLLHSCDSNGGRGGSHVDEGYLKYQEEKGGSGPSVKSDEKRGDWRKMSQQIKSNTLQRVSSPFWKKRAVGKGS